MSMAKRIFDLHHGVDMTGKERKKHFSSLENLWRGGTRAGQEDLRMLRRVPGIRRLLIGDDSIHTLLAAPDGETLLIHAGRALYRMNRHELPALDPSAYESLRLVESSGERISLHGQRADGTACEVFDFLPERSIVSAVLGRALYIADGTHLYRYLDGELLLVAEAGTVSFGDITVTGVLEPYVPLLSRDGVEIEARNLLSDLYRMTFTFRESSETRDGNCPLFFERSADEDGKAICHAVGCRTGNYGSVLVVPDATVLDGVLSSVTDLYPNTVAGTSFTSIVLPAPMRVIPARPLLDCKKISCVRIPRSVTEIHDFFFANCADDLVLEYEGSEEEWKNVLLHHSNSAPAYTVRYGYSAHYRAVGVPLPLPTEEIREATLGSLSLLSENGALAAYPLSPVDGAPATHLLVVSNGKNGLEGLTLSVKGRAEKHVYRTQGRRHLLYVEEKKVQPSGGELVRGARLLTAYDHRLFFGGTPDQPDVIFYSHEDLDGNPDPTYVGVYNYVSDGERMPLTGLYSASGLLMATHADELSSKLVTRAYDYPDAGDVGASTLIVRLYPVKGIYTLNGLAGGAVYDGYLHLLTAGGLCRYARSNEEGYLTVRVQSGRIAPFLSRLSPQDGILMGATLGGMAVLAHGTALYLADTRHPTPYAGQDEYEWYPVTDVGSWSEDEPAYETAVTLEEEECGLYCRTEDSFSPFTAMTEEEARTVGAGDAEMRTLYRREDAGYVPVTHAFLRGTDLLLRATDFLTKGRLYPPTALVTVGNQLFIGTLDGALLTFNTDLEEASFEEGFPFEAYYHHDGHRVTARLSTFVDDGDAPNQRKRTVRGSAYVTLGGMRVSSPTLTVCRDGRTESLALPAVPFAFDTLDFKSLSFLPDGEVTLPIPDGGSYRNISFTLESDGPFAFLALGYRDTRVK